MKEGILMFIMSELPAVLAKSSSASPVDFDLTISIGAIIALSTIISAILVAVVNNFFQWKLKESDNRNQINLRDKEYANQLSIKAMDSKNSLKKYQWETYYNHV